MTNQPDQLPRPELALPSLLTAAEVCQVARYSRRKLAVEIASGRMPKAVSRGRQPIFNRDAVLRALGILSETEVRPAADPWSAGNESWKARDAAWPKDSRGYRLSEKRARVALGEEGWAKLMKL